MRPLCRAFVFHGMALVLHALALGLALALALLLAWTASREKRAHGREARIAAMSPKALCQYSTTIVGLKSQVVTSNPTVLFCRFPLTMAWRQPSPGRSREVAGSD
jgi:hypothetical protein